MPARPCDQARHGEICPGGTRGARHDGSPHPAGRAAVDRRSLPRPHRHRAPARHDAGEDACAFCQVHRNRDRHHGLDRTVAEQVPCQDRLRSRQAARIFNARLERGAVIPGAAAGDLHLGRRQGYGGGARPRRLSHHRGSAARRRDRADAPLRHRRPAARTPLLRHRYANRQPGSRNQKRFCRNDVLCGHRRLSYA